MNKPNATKAPSDQTSKTDRLHDHLARIIASAAPDSRLPSIRALMTRFDISQATVSSALNRLEAQGALYRKQGSGIFVSSAKVTRPILILVDSDVIQSPSCFWDVLLRGLRDRFAHEPERIEIRYTNSGTNGSRTLDPVRQLGEGFFEKLRARAYSGIYLICVAEELTKIIRNFDIPQVGFACPTRYDIHMAWLEACQMGTYALADLGCKRIAQYNPTHAATREVFLAALRTRGVRERVVPANENFAGAEAAFSFHSVIERGFRSALEAFGPESDPSNRPDGVLSLDDMFTQGYLMGLQTLGVEIGKQVQVATHTNEESWSLRGWSNRVIRMEFRVSEISDTMHAALEALIDGKEPNEKWEHATWLSGDDGPFRLAMINPNLYLPTIK